MKKFLVLTSICLAVAVAGLLTTLILGSQRAEANPGFAQQTGKPCTYCHSAPPTLNGTGKKFKANGNQLPK
jgi:hypothetical protein